MMYKENWPFPKKDRREVTSSFFPNIFSALMLLFLGLLSYTECFELQKLLRCWKILAHTLNWQEREKHKTEKHFLKFRCSSSWRSKGRRFFTRLLVYMYKINAHSFSTCVYNFLYVYTYRECIRPSVTDNIEFDVSGL